MTQHIRLNWPHTCTCTCTCSNYVVHLANYRMLCRVHARCTCIHVYFLKASVLYVHVFPCMYIVHVQCACKCMCKCTCATVYMYQYICTVHVLTFKICKYTYMYNVHVRGSACKRNSVCLIQEFCTLQCFVCSLTACTTVSEDCVAPPSAIPHTLSLLCVCVRS